MPRLNTVVAVETGTKNRVNEKLTTVYKTIQKADLFTGHHKTYKPRDEDPTSQFGEKLPDDVKQVQANATKLLKEVAAAQTELYDISFVRDVANAGAKADVVVDGTAILKDVPVTYLLWLAKRFDDLHSEIKKLPVLDPAEQWTYDPNAGMYVTRPAETIRTKKVTMPLVLYPATEQHPAQVKEVTEDKIAGTWSTIKHSAAIPADRKEQLLGRVEKLQKAVKQAREEANMAEVPKVPSVGDAIFNFVLAG